MAHIYRRILIVLFTFVVLAPSYSTAWAQENPNIVLILADDMGYGDVQAYNPQSTIPTPNLNSMAEEAMRFTDAHTNSSVCTPSRYGILTGRYAWRTRLKSGVLRGSSQPLIKETRLTLGSMLKKQGYHTAAVGKWHLGIEWAKDQEGNVDFNQPFKSGPTDLGFDYFFGVSASLDMEPYMFYENKSPVQPATETQSAQIFPRYLREGPKATGFDHSEVLDQLTSQAINYIDQQADKKNPFFLYFALTSPHKPVWPAERFQGTTGLGPYADFIVQTDWTVGQVLQVLEEKGIEDNTLVLFTSDNGSFMFRVDKDRKYPFGESLAAESFKARKVGSGQQDHAGNAEIHGYYPYVHSANYKWRGTKADIWEAGHRVPFMVRWPGHINPNKKSTETISVTDIMATLADIAGYTFETGEGEDSVSLMPLLTGKETTISRSPVVHHSLSGMFAVRESKWKMVFGNGSGGRQVPRGEPFRKPYKLFNLELDPMETTNVIDQYPEVAQKLTKSLDQIREKK